MSKKTKKSKTNPIKGIPEKKKWTKSDFARYYKESKALSDYSCSRSGIIQSRETKKKKPKK
jgi:hypothetical protein